MQPETSEFAAKRRQFELTERSAPQPHLLDLYGLFDQGTQARLASSTITKAAVEHLAKLGKTLRSRGLNAMAVARFLVRIVFCLFAEATGLLLQQQFRNIVEQARDPQHFSKLIGELFAAINDGSDVSLEIVRQFNGQLFTGPVLDLTLTEIRLVKEAARLDWSAVDPSIFGTLFQRGLDPKTRAQLGAQYTRREDIEMLIEPVVMQPLRREWQATRRAIATLIETGKTNPSGKETRQMKETANGARREARVLLGQFHERLQQVKVLDPACGSGNFLYVTLQKLKDLEKEVLSFASEQGFEVLIPQVGPEQFYGIEINPYACELAQVTLWIGYRQWTQANGFGVPADAMPRRLDNFKNMDAILDLSDPENPREPEWPAVDFIVGNPPFLGNRFLANEVGSDYVAALAKVYRQSLGAKPDLVCYFFEKARLAIERRACKRVGLLATQGIRGGKNRNVLKRIRETGDIFFAESNRAWVLNGAAVHVSMVGFDDGTETLKVLDGKAVSSIHANLTADANLTEAQRLPANTGLSFQGSIKRGKFDIEDALALKLLGEAENPNGKPSSDVLLPYLNGMDVTRRSRNVWIIDFGAERTIAEASLYANPFAHVTSKVKRERQKANQPKARVEWYRHWNPRPEMNAALRGVSRFIGTPRVSKYRLFVWLKAPTYPDCQLIVFAREDDYFFGVLHSRAHAVWALQLGTRLETRPRYTPTTCFETFPFPIPASGQAAAIGVAAKELDDLRRRWLNPPEWTCQEILEFPGATKGPWVRYVTAPDERGIGTVRYPRLVPQDEIAARLLARRTLTNLYNERPAWLDLAHRKLDEAVLAAYGWEASITDEEILARLLVLNQERSAAT